MDHVLIDTHAKQFVGRASKIDCLSVLDSLEADRYDVLPCDAVRNFARYDAPTLTALWANTRGVAAEPIPAYDVLCRIVYSIANDVQPLAAVVPHLLREESEMTNVPEQNGVKWPQRGASARVFEIAQQLSTQKQDFATKDEVVNAAVAEGINAGTAGTQYSAWLRYWTPQTEQPISPVAPVAPVAPQAPIAPSGPASPLPAVTQLTPEVIQGVQHAMQHAQTQQHAPSAPPQFAPPAPPQFAAAPQAAVTPFVAPPAAQEIAVGANGVAPAEKQTVHVKAGFQLEVDLSPAIAKLEKLLQTLKDAQEDFGS